MIVPIHEVTYLQSGVVCNTQFHPECQFPHVTLIPSMHVYAQYKTGRATGYCRVLIGHSYLCRITNIFKSTDDTILYQNKIGFNVYVEDHYTYLLLVLIG